MGLVDDGPLCLLQPAMPVATLATGLTAEMLQLQGGSYRDAQAAEDGDASVGSDGSDSPDSQHRDPKWSTRSGSALQLEHLGRRTRPPDEAHAYSAMNELS